MSKIVYKFRIAVSGLNDCGVFETKTDAFSNNNLVFNVDFKSTSGDQTFHSFTKEYTVEELLQKNGILDCEVEYDLTKGEYGYIEYSLKTYYNCIDSNNREFIKHKENFNFQKIHFRKAESQLSYLTGKLIEENDLKGTYNRSYQVNYYMNTSVVTDSPVGYNNTNGRFISFFNIIPEDGFVSDNGKIDYFSNYKAYICLVAEDLNSNEEFIISDEVELQYGEHIVQGQNTKTFNYEGYINHKMGEIPNVDKRLFKVYVRFVIKGLNIFGNNDEITINLKNKYVTDNIGSSTNEFVTFFSSILGSENVKHSIFVNNSNGRDGLTVNRNSTDRLEINNIEINGVPLITSKCQCGEHCLEYFSDNPNEEMRYVVNIRRIIDSEVNEDLVDYHSSSESYFPYFSCEKSSIEAAINRDFEELKTSGRINSIQKIKYKILLDLTNKEIVHYQKNVFGERNDIETEININLTN